MTFTIVSAIMTKDTTTQDVIKELTEKVLKLLKSGWVCFGKISYFNNGVTQAMIPANLSESEYSLVSFELTKHEKNGTRKSKRLVYADTCIKV